MPKILIVDDVVNNVKLLERRFAQQGYEVLTAFSGREALETASAQPPDVILLDIMMPGMDGYEVCRRLKADPRLRSISVVMVTAKDRDEDVIEGLDAGAQDYIAKLSPWPIIAARVRSAVGTKMAHDMLETLNRRLDEARRSAEAASEAKTRVVEQLTREVADRKRVEEELRRSNARLAEALQREQDTSMELAAAIHRLETATEDARTATRSKSEFLANMSHEIRTPLTAIMGFADVLREEVACCTICTASKSCQTRRNGAEHVETIQRNASYLLELINDILDLSKIEAGRMAVERIACSPRQIVTDVASLVRVRAYAKGLPFNIEYVGAVPETIQSDPTRLRQILINLIGNAIKFTEVGGVRLVTRFVGDDDAPHMQFDVVDTGIGMTDEQAGKLFQPFTQADASTTRKFGGTGLGLTISKRLALILGGNITVVETVEGVGTRFRATVATGPLDGVRMIENPQEAVDTAQAAVQDAGSSPHGSGHAGTRASSGSMEGKLECRVLFAEDGPDNQRLVSFVLKKAGARVTVVENGKLALDAALAARDEGNPFDVILMDMQMPVMDGYEATAVLRQKCYTGPIIALTAHAMGGDRDKCIKAGCDDYVAKPIDRATLIETIRRWVSKTLVLEAQAVNTTRP